MNVAQQLLGHNVTDRPEKTAIYYKDQQISFETLNENVNRFANLLKVLNIKPTERVMLVLPDHPVFLYAFLGCIKHGAWPVPISTMFRAPGYEFLMNNSETRLLVTTTDNEAAQVHTQFIEHRLFLDVDLEERLSGCSIEFQPKLAREEDIAFLLYSSGSTGNPKGIPHLHGDMIFTSDHYAKNILDITESDTIYSASKLFFAYGLGNAISYPLRFGASVILNPDPPTPQSVAGIISKFKPTLFFGVPTLYNSMLKHLDGTQDLSSLRLSISAGEALPPPIYHAWKERTNIELLDGIGSTEALHIFISNRPGSVKPGSSGELVKGYLAKIINDDGEEVKTDEPGTLIILGGSVARSYWNRPEKSSETMLDGGWLSTGDMYTRDEDGFYIYQGRGDDMLKVGGIWVSPIKIEDALLEHPSIMECAVVGQSVEGLVKPATHVVLNDGFQQSDELTKEVQEFMKEKVPRYMVPRIFHFVDELPKTSTGKIQRFKLRV